MNRLRRFRKQKGLTIKKVAYTVGIAENTLHQYETEKREPRRETWLKLADYYDVPAFRIFTDGNGNRLFSIEIGFDIVSFDILLRVLDLVKKYMQEEQELNNATYSEKS